MMRGTGHIALALALVWQPVTATQVWKSPSDIPSAVPLACRQALSTNITCSGTLIRAQDVINGAALNEEASARYCTSECHDSLKSFQEGVDTNCGRNTQYVLNMGSATEQFPSAIADELLWAYRVSCIEDTTGFCLGGLYNGQKTACSDCALKYGAAMMNSDYGRNQFPLAAFSSLLSSCSAPATSYTYSYTPLPTATTTTAPTSTSSSTPTVCGGSTYVVQEEDTCESIALANSVGTDRMISRNHLDYACSSLTVGSTLCIEDTCTVYTVKANDTCEGIVQGQTFGKVQLLGWNPTLHQDCDNLESMVGRTLCVSPPGDNGEFTLPAEQTATRPTLTSSLITAWVPGTTVSMPDVTTSWYQPIHDPNYHPIESLTPNATWTSLFAERTLYCWISEEELSDLELWPEMDFPDDCYALYASYCEPPVTDPIPTSTPIPASCIPTSNEEESTPSWTASTSTSTSGVATPTPTQAGMVAGCTKFHQVADGDQCGTIASDYGISQDNFYSWNAGVGDSCGSLWLDYYVCVGVSSTSATKTTTTTTTTATTTSSGLTTPTPTQAGIVDGCTEFHLVEEGDQCGSIASVYGITTNDFYTWNPGVGESCSSLWLGYYVCVGRSSTTTTKTTTKPTSTTTTAVSTPTPTQAGMVSGCRAFHKVSSGDQCGTIASEYGISLEKFYSWNPGVGDSCRSLWLDYYVCVDK